MSDAPTTPSSRGKRTWKDVRVWVISGAVALAGIIVILLLVRSSQPPASVAATDPLINAAGIVNAAEQERQALAKTKLLALRDQAEEVSRALKQAEIELVAWRDRIEPELKGPRGRALVADANAYRQFNEIYNLTRPTEEELHACRTRITVLLEPAEKALSGGTALYLPDDAVAQQFQTERKWALETLRSVQDARRAAEALLAEAAAKGPGGSRTLEEAMAEAKRMHTQELAALAAAKDDAAQREAAERVASAKANQTRQLAEAEAKIIEAETKRKAAALRTESEFADAAAEQNDLKVLAQRPDVQTKYKPFLEKGRFRPNPENCGAERTEAPSPMSYSDLMAFGVFDHYKTFANAGAGCWRKNWQPSICIQFGNDRTKWQKPETEEEFDQYRERFEEFKKLAPIWKDTGVLAP